VPERFVYGRTVGLKKDSLEMSLSLKSDKNTSWYELQARSSDQEALYRIDPASLEVTFSDVTTRGPTSTIRRTTTVLEDRSPPGPDEIVITATEPFMLELRLYPFASKSKTRVNFQGGASTTGFSLEIGVVGRESITVGGRSWDCWRLQFGAGGVLGALMGKSNFWISTAWPNVLVRSEGASGPPGSPVTILELVSYSGAPAPSSSRK
jgi:hypothetical protein